MTAMAVAIHVAGPRGSTGCLAGYGPGWSRGTIGRCGAGVVNELVEDDRVRRDEEHQLYFAADDEQ